MAETNSNFTLKSPQLDSISGLLKTLAALFIVIFGFRYIAKDLIAPILMAIFLSILLTPIFRWFRARGFSAVVSLVLMIISFVVAAIILVTFFTWAIGNLRDSLSTYVSGFKESLVTAAESAGLDQDAVTTAVSGLTPDTILQFATVIIQSFGNIFLYLFFVPFLSFLFLIQFDSMSALAKNELLKDNPNLSRYQYFAESIIVYITGRAKTNLFIAVSFTLVLLLLGIQSAFVWGIMTFILCFVPYIGLLLAAIPPTFLALAQYGTFSALLVLISIGILIILAENIVEPMIQGRGNKLSTATIVVSFVFWIWIFGAVGAILAVPLTVLMKIILADYQETAWVASLMEGSYEMSPKNSQNLFTRFKNIFSR